MFCCSYNTHSRQGSSTSKNFVSVLLWRWHLTSVFVVNNVDDWVDFARDVDYIAIFIVCVLVLVVLVVVALIFIILIVVVILIGALVVLGVL